MNGTHQINTNSYRNIALACCFVFWNELGALNELLYCKKGKAVPLHAMEAFGGRGGIAPTHSRPRH
jgi:hypothetical protein